MESELTAEGLRTFLVVVAARAYKDIADGFSFTGENADSAIAAHWLDRLQAAIVSLNVLPHRFPEIASASKFRRPCPRVMINRRTVTSQAWHVIYRVYEVPQAEQEFVEIIAVRHAARKPMTRREARSIDDAF